MAQYQVPQFIEVEDKIFGPLTLRQFIYLAGGGGLCLMFFTLLPLWLCLLLSAPVLAFAAGLAFYKVNGRPSIVALEHATSYFFGTKLYLWKQHEIKAAAPEAAAPKGPAEMSAVPKMSQSRLKDLAWSLNIKDQTAMGMGPQEHAGFEV
jgi:hypothetical protein